MCDPWYYMKSVWGRCMVELTDLTITIIYEYSTKKRASRASALRADGVHLRVDF